MKVEVIAVEALMDVSEQHVTHCQQNVVDHVLVDEFTGKTHYVIESDNGTLQTVPVQYFEEIGWAEEAETVEEKEELRLQFAMKE